LGSCLGLTLRIDPEYASRNSTNLGTSGNIVKNDRVRTDLRIVANTNSTEEHCTRTDVHPLPKYGNAIEVIVPADPECHTLTDNATVANHAISVNHNARLVLKHHPATDPRRVWQLDPIVISHPTEHHPVQHAQRRSEKLGPHPHAPHAESIDRNGPESGPSPVPPVSMEIFPDEGEKAGLVVHACHG
jgi:hypothetical protein